MNIKKASDSFIVICMCNYTASSFFFLCFLDQSVFLSSRELLKSFSEDNLESFWSVRGTSSKEIRLEPLSLSTLTHKSAGERFL